jgi:intein/homing endonuclease
MPKIPHEYLKDFIRGCIDGDGSICRSNYKASTNGKIYEQTTVSLVSASKSFITSMSEELSVLGFNHSFVIIKPTSRKMKNRIIVSKNELYRIQMSGHKKCVKFLSWLYDDNCLSLPRKNKLASDIIQTYTLRKQI